jgi:ubiquinone/menaquinone biosynthesis C-methylase UbiE
MTENTPSSSKVAELYDELTVTQAGLWNGNLHYGYWTGPDDSSSFEEALDQMTEQVIRRLDPRPGQHVLDLGCGIGAPALRLARDYPIRITGISISPRQVDLASERARDATGLAGEVSFEVADAMNLPYPDGSFDGVMSLESMVHMPDKTRVLKEIARVLRPSGRLSLADIVLRTVPDQRGDSLQEAATTETFSMGKLDEYGELLSEAGLVPLEITDVSEHTRRSYPYFVAGAESCREDYIRVIGLEEFEKRLEEGRQLELVPEIGYVLIAAKRPES